VRVEVGKPVRVGPGDEIVIRGQLPKNSRLGRLYVFAREGKAKFSPYVANVGKMLAVVGERPQMYTPMSMRLSEQRPQHEISFVADIDGWFRIMQEVDRADDAKAIVKIKRRIDPTLPWRPWLVRYLRGLWPWA